MSLMDKADPLRSSPDRPLAQAEPSKPKEKTEGGAHMGQILDAHGLCPSCGQQLYQIRPASGGFLPCCFGSDDHPVRKVPLTIPMHVERGQCLTCNRAEKSLRSVSDTNSSTSAGNSFKSLDDFCQSTERDALLEMNTHSIGHRKSPSSGDSSNLQPPSPGSTTSKLTIKPPPGSGYKPPSPLRVTLTQDEILMHDDSLRKISYPQPWLPAGTAVYHGPYNDYGQRNGEGEMIWSNGDVYHGSFINDVRQGHGTLSFAIPKNVPNTHDDGGEYVGDWQNDQMHGSGTRRYPNGDLYMGDYEAGARHGQGRFYYANGDLYWGNWKSNHMHGPGRYYYASGQRFEGMFQHDKRTGMGKLQRTDGTLEVFQYVNDQRVGQGVRWSADRSRVWRLWMPSNGGRTGQHSFTAMTGLEKQKITATEAASLVCDIEQAADCSMEGNAWFSS